MKIVHFYKSEKQLIQRAAKKNRDAQRQLYEKFAPKMLGVCRRYIKDVYYAEEVMLNGFLKVFLNIHQYSFQGSFEGWIRRIMVNESITYIRKQKEVFFSEDILGYTEASWNNTAEALDVAAIQELIDDLPNGYKMVFMLYAVEGYKHSEIAKMLNVSENTSKSQLFKARKMLQEKMNLQNKMNNGTTEVR